MRKRWLILACGLLIGTAGVTAADAPAGPCAPVPEIHWAYDGLAQVQMHGLLRHYSSGAFSGRQLLSRFELAQAISGAVFEFQPQAVALQAKLAQDQAFRKPMDGRFDPTSRDAWDVSFVRMAERDGDVLSRLILVFAPELEALGEDVPSQREALRKLGLDGSQLLRPYHFPDLAVITGTVHFNVKPTREMRYSPAKGVDTTARSGAGSSPQK